MAWWLSFIRAPEGEVSYAVSGFHRLGFQQLWDDGDWGGSLNELIHKCGA